MRRLRLLLLPGLLLLATQAQAEQGCPEGFVPNPTWTQGQQQCIPGPSGGSGEPTSWSYEQTNTPWTYNGHGAFAFDAKGKNIGVSDPEGHFAFVWEAKRSAVKSCKQNGGSNCKVIATFKNECAVSMLGATNSRGNEVAIYVGKGATVDAAKDDAQTRCKASGSPICEPAYSDCAERWSQ